MSQKLVATSTLASIRNVVSLLAAFAMALSWLIPNHYPPWTSFYNDACMAIALLLFVLSQPLTRQSPGMPLAAWFVIALIAIPWLQWAFGLLLFSGDAWVSTLYLLGFAIAISTGHTWASKEPKKLATLIASATVAAACVSACIGLIQTLHGDVLGIWGHTAWPGMRAEGNLAQPNNLGTLMGFGAVSLLLLYEQSHVGKISGVIVLGLLLVGAALTQSRTALLFGEAIFCALFFFKRQHSLTVRIHLPTIAIATMLHWAMAWSWPFIAKTLLLSPTSSLDERGATNRLAAWRLFIGAINEAPWAGWGWLQSGAAQFAMAERYPAVRELFAETHNLLLELLVWCGYPLGMLVCLVLAYWFVSRFRRISTVEAFCGWLTAAVLAVHSMLEWPYHYAYFLIPAALWAGVIEYSIHAKLFLSYKSIFGPLVLSLVLLTPICTEYLIIEDDFRLARFEYLKIGSLHAARSAPDAPFLSNLTEYSRFHRTPPRTDMSDKDINAIRAVTIRYPYARLLYGYAEALALNGRLNEAKRVFQKIRQIHGERIYQILRLDVEEKARTQADLVELARSLQQPVYTQ